MNSKVGFTSDPGLQLFVQILAVFAQFPDGRRPDRALSGAAPRSPTPKAAYGCVTFT
jgi:hypothetical protein